MPPPLESNDNVSLGLINTAQDTGASQRSRCRDDHKHAAAHKTLDAPMHLGTPAGRDAQMRRSTPDRASVLPAKRDAAPKCDTTPLQNRHDGRISTLLVEKTGSNSGKSTIIGGCNARSSDSQPMPSRKENQSNLVTWGNEKTVPVSSPSVIPNGPNRTRRPPNIVDLPEFRVVFATTTRTRSIICPAAPVPLRRNYPAAPNPYESQEFPPAPSKTRHGGRRRRHPPITPPVCATDPNGRPPNESFLAAIAHPAFHK